MKEERSTSEYGLRVTLRVYVLALLLATFIAALHAGILFGLADLLMVLREAAEDGLAPRLMDILLVVGAISGLFAAHIGETAMWGVFFWKSGRLASFSDGWYFAGVSHTRSPLIAETFGCSTAFLFLILQSVWQHPT